jgi:hypothetical protein
MKKIKAWTAWLIMAGLVGGLTIGCASAAKNKVSTGVSKTVGEKPKVNVGVSRTKDVK